MGDKKHKSAAKSAAMKRWWAALSPEERTAYQKRRFAGMTPEERSARQRLTHPGISERTKRQMLERWAKCTGEERAQEARELAERRRVEREAEEWCRLHKVGRSRRDGNGAGDGECQGNVN